MNPNTSVRDINQYKILNKLGQGMFGTVTLAIEDFSNVNGSNKVEKSDAAVFTKLFVRPWNSIL